MDRACKKKPGLVVLAICGVFAGMFLLAGIYLQYRYQEAVRTTAELSVLLPESEGIWVELQEKRSGKGISEAELLAAEKRIKEKYDYTLFNTRESRAFQKFFLGEIFLAGVFLAGGMYWIVVRQQKAGARQRQEIEALGDCVRAFSEGDYHSWSLGQVELPELSDLKEQLGKLGTAMENLEEKLWREETHTKALITDISHQLKTPFAALKLSYEMAEDKNLTSKEQEEFFIQGKRELENLEALMELLLNFSRLEGNMVQLKPKPGNLKNTLLGAVNTVIMKAVGKEIEISAEALEDCRVLHDVRWTQEAMINVLDNAIKYSDSGTTIEISMKKLTSYALVEIADQGMGISEREKNKIFQRFYRGEQAKERERDGAGVGLYLTRTIVEQQGGTVCVKEGHKKKGSCFWIMLPLESAGNL